ncbi:MAG: NUDIX domain-containing protein [Candidatus ainarchaeum sp.]|nr:NUDIX domain-containing protein [Candidatus ainarchaeum sp.]
MQFPKEKNKELFMDKKKQTGLGIIGILLDGNEVLLGQRNKETGKGLWELPGGHLEFNEGFEECIKREFLEETGITIEVQRLVSVSANKAYGNHYVVLGFLVASKSKPKIFHREPENHSAWKWFDLEKLPELFIATKDAIRDFKAGKIYSGK